MNWEPLPGPTRNTAVYNVLRNRETDRRPIRVGVVGTGTTGRAIALQLGTPVPGIRLAGVANRTQAHAERALKEAGISSWSIADSPAAAEKIIASGATVLTQDPMVLTRCDAIDILVEVTGTIDFAAGVVLDAIEHGKHVVLVNADLDSLLGPILKMKADAAGVVLTHTDGDEPGVAMTLVRYLQSVGLKPVAAGNIKGMVDYYRTPDTQRAWAEQHKQDARKVTSFADATKLSMETTVLANATGFRAGKRGMYGYSMSYVRDIGKLLPAEQMLNGGLVDYSIGANPHTGAFVVIHEDNPHKQRQLAYFKLGDGPFYVFYTPFHLPHLQLPSTIGRAVIHGDPTVTPIAGPVCQVVTMAKRDLKAGERLDGIGGFCTYGLTESVVTAAPIRALPIGLSEECVLRKDIAKDSVITFDDVKMPAARMRDKLWAEQIAKWPYGPPSAESAPARSSSAA